MVVAEAVPQEVLRAEPVSVDKRDLQREPDPGLGASLVDDLDPVLALGHLLAGVPRVSDLDQRRAGAVGLVRALAATARDQHKAALRERLATEDVLERLLTRLRGQIDVHDHLVAARLLGAPGAADPCPRERASDAQVLGHPECEPHALARELAHVQSLCGAGLDGHLDADELALEVCACGLLLGGALAGLRARLQGSDPLQRVGLVHGAHPGQVERHRVAKVAEHTTLGALGALRRRGDQWAELPAEAP